MPTLLKELPLTSNAGEWLEGHVADNALVRRHAELGDGLLPWAGGLFVLAVVLWWKVGRTTASGHSDGSRRPAALVRVAAAVLTLVVAGGASVDVYRIGDSGAKAAWHDGYSKSALQGGDEG
ncbi:hypothetical protein [Streptomyces sp. NPDC127066]|uniref:hypothetical protein n=1 Tax=Streptomyces sp. NPDC127066 TaxID=3347125 RepID=UPI003669D95B